MLHRAPFPLPPRLGPLQGLRVRLLLTLAAAVFVSLGTVAVTARWATRAEFERYVQRNRHDVQSIAEQLAIGAGDRIVFADRDGRVLADAGADVLVQLPDRQLSGTALAAPGAAVEATWAAPAALGPAAVAHWEASARSDGAAEVQRVTGDPPPTGAIVIRAFAPPSGLGVGEPGRLLPEFLPATAAMPVFDARIAAPATPEALYIGSVNRTLAVAVAVSGLVSLLLATTVSRRILGPVDALTAAARKMEAGDLSQRVAVGSRDEIGQLAHAFNAMAGRLARTEQLRRTMIADVAHELRTPLANVRGYLEALRDGVAAPAPPLLESLHEEALLLTRLVEDLQELTLAEAGQLSLATHRVAISDVARQALRAAAPAATAKGVTLSLQAPIDLPAVRADAARVGQVLRNLIANALRHTPPGGAVTIAAEAQDGLVRVSVRDTGEGIAPEHLPYVFERFYRADPSRARATGGAGMGLAIVRGLIVAQGGTVAVASTPGQGATFHFTLPLERSRAHR